MFAWNKILNPIIRFMAIWNTEKNILKAKHVLIGGVKIVIVFSLFHER